MKIDHVEEVPNVDHAQAIYLEQKGWFWVVTIGSRMIYWGPYKTKQEAEGEKEKNSSPR